MSQPRVAIVAGARTPFVKAGKGLEDPGPLSLARAAVDGLIERHEVDPETIATLANEMARRDSSYGLISICAGGAMAGAFVLER